MYINFLLETQVATANAEYIAYASPLRNVQENQEYCYYQNEIIYPSKDIPQQQFTDLPADIRSYYESLWEEILRESK